MTTSTNNRNVYTGEMLASCCFSRKVSVSLHQKGGSSAATSFDVHLNLHLQCNIVSYIGTIYLLLTALTLYE